MSLSNAPANTKAIIFGCADLSLSADERAFFKQAKPLGFILFARNVDTPDQVKALLKDLRETVGWHCPVLVDQEGGRVARLKAPHWPEFKPARELVGNAVEFEQSYQGLSKLVAEEGFDVNCVPVVDVPVEGAHDIIGDRAYGTTPEIVSKSALEVIRISRENSITPVIKHIPGHGRAFVDSHEDLPLVDTDLETLKETDFKAFKDVCADPLSSSAWGMTAHVIYSAIDPDLPATFSKAVIQDIIRGHIGFKGLLLGDDLFMKALDKYGDIPTRIKMSQEAGIDAHLHCHGDVHDMQAAIEVTKDFIV